MRLGDIANDCTFILSSMFLMKFYINVMGVESWIVGVMMMVARIVDAFTDMTMGRIVDLSKPTRQESSAPGSCEAPAWWRWLVF